MDRGRHEYCILRPSRNDFVLLLMIILPNDHSNDRTYNDDNDTDQSTKVKGEPGFAASL